MRNLKTLGLALVAVLAFGALAASAASAQQGELTSDGPVTLDIAEKGEGENFLSAFGQKVECPGSSYTGHKFDTTPHTLIPVPATTATITPHYEQDTCETGEGLPATVDVPPDCDFVFHIGNTVGTDEYGLVADVECTKGSKISVEVFAGDAHGFRLCTISVGTQTGLTGATATNEEGGLNINGVFTGIHAEESGLCGSATETEAEFSINATAKGTDAEGGPTAISITD